MQGISKQGSESKLTVAAQSKLAKARDWLPEPVATAPLTPSPASPVYHKGRYLTISEVAGDKQTVVLTANCHSLFVTSGVQPATSPAGHDHPLACPSIGNNKELACHFANYLAVRAVMACSLPCWTSVLPENGTRAFVFLQQELGHLSTDCS